jgi:hypothetical protein
MSESNMREKIEIINHIGKKISNSIQLAIEEVQWYLQ